MAKQGFRVIDSDLHLEEPFDLWERALEEPYRSLTKITPPEGGHTEAGGMSIEIAGRAIRTRSPRQKTLVQRQSTRHVPSLPHLVEARARCTPDLFIEGMGIEGIDVAILVPTIGLHIFLDDELDPAHAVALCRVYNDWAFEFTRANPERFKLWAWVPRQDPALAAQEARRCVEEYGAVGVATTQAAVAGHLLCDDAFEPLWEEMERLRVPFGLHIFGSSLLPTDARARFRGHPRAELVSTTLGGSFDAHACVVELIVGGVLERHPGLRPVIMESGASWVPWLLWRMDEKWEIYAPDVGYGLSMKPSEYFRRQCSVVMDPSEDVAKYVIDAIGDRNLLFSTDYPHHDSAFPEAVDTFLGLEGISEESKRRILWENGAKLYGLETHAAEPLASAI